MAACGIANQRMACTLDRMLIDIYLKLFNVILLEFYTNTIL